MPFFTNFKGRKGLPDDQTGTILVRYLDRDFKVSPMTDTKTSIDQIDEIANRFGVKYPLEFTAHLCGEFPGIHVEVKEDVWARPKAYDVGPFWSFLYGLHTYTSAASSPDWMRLDYAAESFQRLSGLTAAPILQIIGDANLYCVDSAGRIGVFDHETNEIEPVDLDFWKLFEKEIAELCARKVLKDAQSTPSQ